MMRCADALTAELDARGLGAAIAEVGRSRLSHSTGSMDSPRGAIRWMSMASRRSQGALGRARQSPLVIRCTLRRSRSYSVHCARGWRWDASSSAARVYYLFSGLSMSCFLNSRVPLRRPKWFVRKLIRLLLIIP